MPTYKLQYFSIRAKAEFIRWIFHHKGVAFEDEHVDFATWAELKAKMPMGQMPVLTVDDTSCLCQTAAIGAFLGATLGLAGQCPLEAARCVMMAGGLEDETKNFGPITKALLMDKDEAKAKELTKEYETGALKVFAERYEGFIVKNGGEFLVGKALTWADIYTSEFVDRFLAFCPAAFANTPKLVALRNKVIALPGIKKFAETRTAIPL